MKLPSFQGEFIRSGATVFIATLLAALVAFFANVILSNLLGPAEFGNFKVVIYLFAFLPILADFGINSSLTKYISEFGKDSKKVGHLIKWLLKVKLVSYILLVAAVFLLRDSIALYFLKDASLGYLVLAGAVLLALNFFATFSFIAIGFQNFKVYGLSQFLSAAVSSVFAVLLSGFGMFYMILGWSLGPLIGNMPGIILLIKKRIIGNHETFDVKRIFYKFSLPIYPIDLSTNFISVIVPVLSLFFSQQSVGYYSFAFMFYTVAMLIPNSLSIVLFPKVSELNGLKDHAQASHILRKSFLYYSFFVVIGVVALAFLSEWFIGFIARDYLPSALIFKVIVLLGALFGYNVIYTNYLKGLGRVRRYALLTLAQNIFLIVVSFALLSSMA